MLFPLRPFSLAPRCALAATAVLCLTVMLANSVSDAVADEIDHMREYKVCMALIDRTPEEAFEKAIAWRDLGGGDAARHCAATALIGLRQFGEAAKRLEALAREIKAGPGFKAEILAQAGQALLLGGKPARAAAVLTGALKLSPDDADLLVDRAAALAAAGRYREAVVDLDRAIERDPTHADAFIFRASAHRFLDDLTRALADAEQGLRLNPGHAEGLLERGIIHRLNGDDASARRDWLNLARTAPSTPAAKAARANLARMDVKNTKP